jgi:lysine 2,3-aminomutase
MIYSVDNDEWENWVWHQKNAITSVDKIMGVFPSFEKSLAQKIKVLESKVKFKITPHLLSLVKTNKKGIPLINDPILNQFIPYFLKTYSSFTPINKLNENWELEGDMINPILQHKYPNKVLLRIENTCLSLCMFCFEAKRTLDFNKNKERFTKNYFVASLDYIKRYPNIKEIVLSGGDPLQLSNINLEFILKGIREMDNDIAIRIHTRSSTHNPFRLNDELFQLINQYNVTSIVFHIAHPNEISDGLLKALNRSVENRCRIQYYAQIPLLKGINDDENILSDLFMRLYKLNIRPYYLLHGMPDTLFPEKYRTSVKKGVELMKKIKRNYSNTAVPEYIIVHKTGKHSVPLEFGGTPEFQYHKGYIKFKNWKGDWSVYDDSGYD